MNVMYDRAADLIQVIAPGVPRGEIEELPGWKADALGADLVYPEPAVLILASRHNLSVSRVAREAIEERARMIEMSFATEASIATALGPRLRPYQAVTAGYALALGHAILGDEPGLGKTAQAIDTFETQGRFPVLIVCPKSLTQNWLKEIAVWSGRPAAVSDGRVIPEADYIVMSYESHNRYRTSKELAA